MKRMLMAIMAVAVAVSFSAPSFAGEEKKDKKEDKADDKDADAAAKRLAIEFHRAEHIAVIGHGHGRLLEHFDALEHLVDLIGAIEKTVFRVTVEMYKTRMFHCSF